MNDSYSTVAVVFIFIFDIALAILSGILTWNWIEPDSFGNGILFVIVWGIFIGLGHVVSQVLAAILVGLLSNWK